MFIEMPVFLLEFLLLFILLNRYINSLFPLGKVSGVYGSSVTMSESASLTYTSVVAIEQSLKFKMDQEFPTMILTHFPDWNI